MKNKRLIVLLSTAAVVALTIFACKDNFNESDFLKLNNTLRTQADTSKFNQQVKALNDAGQLLSFTVQVVEDRTPLPGVAVSISNDVSNSALTSTVTTDANGNAVFSKVKIGSNTLLLSKTGYISATAVVDFGTVQQNVNYTVTTGANNVQNIVPIKQSKSVLLPLFATGGTVGASTATIEGKVTIETDLTNKTPEVPQGLTVVANYATGLASVVTGNSGVAVNSYSFNQAGIGVAKVDNTTGAYSMVVPATATGLSMSLLLPTVDAAQKVAAINLDGSPMPAGPSYMNVPTSFGPTVQYDVAIPSVPGALVVFPAPPTPGAGLNFIFAAVPGSLGGAWDTNTAGVSPNEGDPSQFDLGNAAYQLTSRGSGYTASPTITLSGGGTNPVPTQGVMRASLKGNLNSVAVNAAGSGYVSGDVVTINFRYKDNNSSNYTLLSYFATVTATAGAITSLTFPTSGYGIDLSNPWRTVNVGPFASGFSVVSFDATLVGGSGTGATVTPTFSAMVDAINLQNGGANYTSAPTITFTNGGSTTQATLVVKEFRTQWTVSPDNSGNTTAYSLLPSAITFEFSGLNFSPVTDANVRDQYNNNNSYINHLSVSNGNVVQTDPTLVFHTNKFSSAAPHPIVTSTVATMAKATATISATNGNITALTTTTGSGYNAAYKATIQPTVAGAPGSGAAVDLGANFTVTNGEYKWNGNYTLTSQGAGYLTDLNAQNNAPVNAGAYNFSGNTNQFTIKTGDVQVFNFNYGTGKRKQNIN